MSSADRRAYGYGIPLTVGALALSSALALVAWGASPYGGYLQHRHEQANGAAGEVAGLGLFLAGWLLMSMAMMLPTATNLLRDFALTVRRRPDRGRLRVLVVVGFLSIWVATGYVFRTFDGVVHAIVAAIGWLEHRPDLIAAVTLIAAGLFQFSSLHERCLTACRSPRSFIVCHWRGGNPRVEALRIGLAYGASCVGCCWAIMLVMFALGSANLAWMLALATVMAVEKNVRWGRRLVRPVGAGMVGAGLLSLAL
jgi:predicted metal-binding membrane protein